LHRHTLRIEPFAMKTIIKTIWCVLVLAVSAAAANYTVKSGGGGNYTKIQACATAMSAGDTCTVYAGTYNEDVTVSAGSVGGYKTLTVNPGDTVFVLSFTISSHVKINGFHIQNPSSPNSRACVSPTTNTTDYYVTNNNMYACMQFVREPGAGSNVTHGFITGNTMSYSCSTSSSPNVCTAMQINGDYHLIENNDISHVSDGPYIFGKHNVLRKNTFHDVYDSDCGSNSGNCHIDFFQADANVAGGGQPAQYMLIEGNTVNNMVSANGHGSGLLQAEACNGQCYNAIIRFNVESHFGSGAITDDNSGASEPPQAWINIKSYNNDWIDANNQNIVMGGGTHNFSHGSFGGAVINDLFYYPGSLTDFNPYFCLDTACSPFTFGHNLAFCTGDTCNIRSHVYGSGAFTDDPGNIKADPSFVNYGADNFHLNAGSPAIGAGTSLTTTVGTGSSSTALTVADAGYFQDGSGIPGVQADWIRIGASTTVQISSVNYSTNVLTLASAVSWNKGDPIYIYKISDATTVLTGTKPDLGAFPSTSSTVTSNPAPPTNLTAIVQ
jgi:hypothetical protein